MKTGKLKKIIALALGLSMLFAVPAFAQVSEVSNTTVSGYTGKAYISNNNPSHLSCLATVLKNDYAGLFEGALAAQAFYYTYNGSLLASSTRVTNGNGEYFAVAGINTSYNNNQTLKVYCEAKLEMKATGGAKPTTFYAVSKNIEPYYNPLGINPASAMFTVLEYEDLTIEPLQFDVSGDSFGSLLLDPDYAQVEGENGNTGYVKASDIYNATTDTELEVIDIDGNVIDTFFIEHVEVDTSDFPPANSSLAPMSAFTVAEERIELEPLQYNAKGKSFGSMQLNPDYTLVIGENGNTGYVRTSAIYNATSYTELDVIDVQGNVVDTFIIREWDGTIGTTDMSPSLQRTVTLNHSR